MLTDGLWCLRENWSFALAVEYAGQETSAVGAEQLSPARSRTGSPIRAAFARTGVGRRSAG